MDLFAQLHAEGQTVVIVTHDPGIAAACRRIVRLHDGRIAEDRLNG
jgi:putative ABC transport system ATP-binding protein